MIKAGKNDSWCIRNCVLRLYTDSETSQGSMVSTHFPVPKIGNTKTPSIWQLAANEIRSSENRVGSDDRHQLAQTLSSQDLEMIGIRPSL